jgi:hypothetical protein
MHEALEIQRDPTQLFRKQYESLWSFWQHGVTSSFLGSFLTCMEQTRLSYVEGWASKTMPLAIEFGSCCHWVLEQGYTNLMDSPLQGEEDARRWAKCAVEQYEQLWMSRVDHPSGKQLEQQELVYGMAEAVLPTYFKRWDGDFIGEYTYGNNTVRPKKWVSLEKVFRISYQFADGMNTCIRGRRDGLFLDAQGRYWVFDTKCRSIISDDDTLDVMHLDLQQMLYLYCTYRELKLAKAKNPYPKGMVLNVIRRPGHRRLKDETLQTFLERMRKDVEMPKRFDHFFIRYQLEIQPEDLDNWIRNQLRPIMRAVRSWWEGSLPHYCNTLNLITKYGRCPLFLPIVKGVYDHCYKRKVAFSELVD